MKLVLFCVCLAGFLFLAGNARLLENAMIMPRFPGEDTRSLLNRADSAVVTLCTGTNFGGTCTNFTLAVGNCSTIDPPYSANLWSAHSSAGFICFLFRNPTCTGCEACVDAGGWPNMSTFAGVHSMQCKIPDALACSNALCTHAGGGPIASSSTTTLASSSTTASTQTGSPSSSGSDAATIAGSVVGGVVGLTAVALSAICLVRRRRNRARDPPLRIQRLSELSDTYRVEPFAASPTTPVPASTSDPGSARTAAFATEDVGLSSSGRSSKGLLSPISTTIPMSPTVPQGSAGAELEERIRYLEQRLATAEGGPRRETIALSPTSAFPRTPIDERVAQEQIQDLRSEIDGLRQQQRDLLRELRDTPPEYDPVGH
ncbi:hypothetical protein LshimejAT787_0706290 [Lyophyllum shimeji]|uniref:Uncharacterized protein n=1 Tax=Lyophyllum shimeji TaxID=47721 RepID=A0A9P3UM74_LYOSH|nr:hypothetical protein LshimejAT787_0706290 [Lyophyllum shimeji]